MECTIEPVSWQLDGVCGMKGVSVNDLMAVGLTHGSFCGHFASKDPLAAVAGQRAVEEPAQRWGNTSGEHSQHRLIYGCLDVKQSDCRRKAVWLPRWLAFWLDNPVQQAYHNGLQTLL